MAAPIQGGGLTRPQANDPPACVRPRPDRCIFPNLPSCMEVVMPLNTSLTALFFFGLFGELLRFFFW
ncbi:hypothetical protein GPA22_01645 [Aromatoleum toluvorans]|uniref:Uncharacterized protein n=1 Tax=Aromatoleum toluvorans TaxID=92002 RepID=A0ABX1PSL6_9RHOO|nr:hypothetical protein [Aromatoleum toluvorans]NMG42437.1 hypothetical protein [Aromatoleum toluvorans]